LDWLFNRNGNAELFVYDDRFISKNGHNLGWLFNEKVYNIRNGRHLGWFEKGILYDGSNKVIAFSRNATGNLPSRPGIGGTPGTPGVPGRPGRPGLSGTSGRPGYGGWSNQALEEFFGEKF